MIANLLPAKVRSTVYAVLGALTALEIVWDVLPAQIEEKVLGSLVVLGFGLAFSKTGDPVA